MRVVRIGVAFRSQNAGHTRRTLFPLKQGRWQLVRQRSIVLGEKMICAVNWGFTTESLSAVPGLVPGVQASDFLILACLIGFPRVTLLVQPLKLDTKPTAYGGNQSAL
jgi:hypothetical protein